MATCELCGIGNTQRSTKPIEYEYKGHKITLEQSGIYCDNCGEGILEPSDLRENRADLVLFNAMVDMIKAEDDTVEIPEFSSKEEFIEWVRNYD